MQVRTTSPEVVKDLQEENRLVTAYNSLMSKATFDYQGKTRTLAEMTKFGRSINRETRKEAFGLVSNFFQANNHELDQIYSDLLKVRARIAKDLGFNNFTELAYLRLARSEYGPGNVKAFRDLIKTKVVPLVTEIVKKQQKFFNLKEFYDYDLSLNFPDGNPEPKDAPDVILENGLKMYTELSDETREFFEYITQRELLDLLSRPGKNQGGYCSLIPNERAPFIFANFNGTSGDISVLTHEAGHAFQVYLSLEQTVPEYYFATLDACEIHSMTMEYITWPWMNLFFKEDAEKFKTHMLINNLKFLPYGCLIDEFQHEVFANPAWSPKERDLCFRKLEKTYLPHKAYDDNPYLEAGAFWKRQLHIYNSPFYYIDYVLALVCAMQFWIRFEQDFDSAWKDYLHLCKLGGSKSFLELVKEAKLASPFEPETLENVVDYALRFLESRY